jgi:hypothetical protein
MHEHINLGLQSQALLSHLPHVWFHTIYIAYKMNLLHHPTRHYIKFEQFMTQKKSKLPKEQVPRQPFWGRTVYNLLGISEHPK